MKLVLFENLTENLGIFECHLVILPFFNGKFASMLLNFKFSLFIERINVIGV